MTQEYGYVGGDGTPLHNSGSFHKSLRAGQEYLQQSRQSREDEEAGKMSRLEREVESLKSMVSVSSCFARQLGESMWVCVCGLAS